MSPYELTEYARAAGDSVMVAPNASPDHERVPDVLADTDEVVALLADSDARNVHPIEEAASWLEMRDTEGPMGNGAFFKQGGRSAILFVHGERRNITEADSKAWCEKDPNRYKTENFVENETDARDLYVIVRQSESRGRFCCLADIWPQCNRTQCITPAYVLATTECPTQLINDGAWDVTKPNRTRAEYLAAGKTASNTQMCMVLEWQPTGYEICGAAFFITGARNPAQENEYAHDAYLPVQVGQQALTTYGLEFWHEKMLARGDDPPGAAPDDGSGGGGVSGGNSSGPPSPQQGPSSGQPSAGPVAEGTAPTNRTPPDESTSRATESLNESLTAPSTTAPALRTFADPATIGDGVEVKPSWIEAAGGGAFVTEDFAKGDIITEYDHDHSGLLSLEDVAQLLVQTHVLTYEPKRAYLNGIRTPAWGRGAASFANDCFNCLGKPLPHGFEGTFEYNAELVKPRDDRYMNRAFLRALRPLRKGEEIYWDYEDRDLPMGVKRLSIKTLGSDRVCEFEDAYPLTYAEETAMVEYAAALEQLKLAHESKTRADMQVEIRNRRCKSTAVDAKELRSDASKAEKEVIACEQKEASERLRGAKAAAKVVESELKAVAKRVEAAAARDFELRGFQTEWTELHTRGFTVAKKGEHSIEVASTPEKVAAIKDSTKFMPIFNSNDEAESSHRLQGRKSMGGGVLREMAEFEAQSNALLDKRKWRRTASGSASAAFKDAEDAYALSSVADCKDAMQHVPPRSKPRYGCKKNGCKGGCAKQHFHGDSTSPRTYLDAGVPWGDVPLVMLLATEDDTRLHVRPFDKGGAEETVTLNAGDLVIFRGDLSHAGAAYDKDNLRVHVYIDSKLHKRAKDKTYKEQ